jgi:hypothetical protein
VGPGAITRELGLGTLPTYSLGRHGRWLWASSPSVGPAAGHPANPYLINILYLHTYRRTVSGFGGHGVSGWHPPPSPFSDEAKTNVSVPIPRHDASG